MNDIQNDTSIYHPVKVNEGQIVIVPQFVLHFSPPNKSTKKKKNYIMGHEFNQNNICLKKENTKS